MADVHSQWHVNIKTCGDFPETGAFKSYARKHGRKSSRSSLYIKKFVGVTIVVALLLIVAEIVVTKRETDTDRHIG